MKEREKRERWFVVERGEREYERERWVMSTIEERDGLQERERDS